MPASYSDSGYYEITVTLKEDNNNPQFSTYTFVLAIPCDSSCASVIASSTANNSDSSNSSSNDTTGTYITKVKKNIKSSSVLTAQITDISVWGIASITFSEPIIIPINYLKFDKN